MIIFECFCLSDWILVKLFFFVNFILDKYFSMSLIRSSTRIFSSTCIYRCFDAKATAQNSSFKFPKYLTVPFSSKHEMLMKIIRNYLTMKGQLLKRCVLISARFVSHARGSCGGLFFIIWHLVARSLVTASCRLRLRTTIIVLECSDCYKWLHSY